MKIIHRARNAGKTMEAVRIAAETGAYMIVHSMDEAKRVSHVAEEMGLNIRYPVTFNEFLHHRGLAQSRVRNVVIDNADALIEHLFAGFTIEAVTWTEPEQNHDR